jgi:hypothetical protein
MTSNIQFREVADLEALLRSKINFIRSYNKMRLLIRYGKIHTDDNLKGQHKLGPYLEPRLG